MPRLRSQRTPLAAAATGPATDEEPFRNAPAPEEQAQSLPVRDPQQEQIFRTLPNSLSREQKLAALGWRGGCFCCPADISFAQCISGLCHAARKPAESADALVHWGLNASKFLFEAGAKGGYGRNLLLRAGFASLVPQLLPFSEEVPQSIALTPQVFFVQVFATGGRQLPLSTTPQLVMMGLLSLTTLSPATLRDTLAGGGPDLVAALVRCLAASTDNRFRALNFQTLTEWLNIFEGNPLAEDEEGGGKEGGGGGGSAVEQDALIDSLFDAGLAPAVIHVLESCSNAAVLRDTCAFLLALLAGGLGGGVAAGRKAAASAGGGGGGGGHGGVQPHGPMRVAGLTALELTADAALEGRARCRARTELLKAGLVPALLSALSRRPSQLMYWLAINMGVSGARHLEMQWLMLVVARMSVLPQQQRQGQGQGQEGTADGAAPAEVGSGAGGSSGTATATGTGTGGKGSQPGGKQRGRARRGGSAVSAEEAEQLRLAAAELLLRSPMFGPWLEQARQAAVAEGVAEAVSAGAGDAVPLVDLTEASGDAEAGTAAARKVTADSAEAAGAAREGAEAVERAKGAAPEAKAGGTPTQPLGPDARAVKLLSRVIAGSTLRSCVLPDGLPLEGLPPRERNATPDFRTLQRDRIRRAAEEARAAQALAGATSAVDVLSKAMAVL